MIFNGFMCVIKTLLHEEIKYTLQGVFPNQSYSSPFLWELSFRFCSNTRHFSISHFLTFHFLISHLAFSFLIFSFSICVLAAAGIQCYSCTGTGRSAEAALTHCVSNQTAENCTEAGMTNRCLTSILSRNITGFHFVYQKLCTSDTPQTCKSMTATGLFSYCHRTNCSVNLCNNKMPAPAPPTTGRPTQQTNTTGSANSSVSTTVLTGVNNTPTSGCSANLLTATSWKIVTGLFILLVCYCTAFLISTS